MDGERKTEKKESNWRQTEHHEEDRTKIIIKP